MSYRLFNHRHRFAVWAAARATQRGFADVGVLRDALEATDIMEFVGNPASLGTDEAEFMRHHRRWCNSIITFLKNRGVINVTYGRAAKLVAVYLKVMIVIGPHAASALASVAHPPIDRILLRNLAQHSQSIRRVRWRTTAWTMLDEDNYYALISEIRQEFRPGEPFWKLERYRTVTNESEPGAFRLCRRN